MRGRGRKGKYPTFRYDTTALFLPLHSHPATIEKTNQNIRLTGWTTIHEEDITTTNHNEEHRWLLDSLTLDDDNALIWRQDIEDGTIKVVSDGSYNNKDKAGTAAWIMESACGNYQMGGTAPVPGPPESQSSHRSELFGLIAATLHINKFCKAHAVRQGSIRMGCDGLGAINIAKEDYEITKTSRKNFDFINILKQAKKAYPIEWSYQHVSAHQDDIKPYEDLNRWEQLNVIVDHHAKEAMKELLAIPSWQQCYSFSLPHEHCSVTFTDRTGHNTKIVSHLLPNLNHCIGSKIIRGYWVTKKKFSAYTERWIDWEAVHKSHAQLQPARQQWLSKFLTGFCGTGKMIQRYGTQTHSTCPRCGAPAETALHTITCPHQGASELWDKEIHTLRTWMHNNQGHTEMTNAICDKLNAWRYNQPSPIITTSNRKLREGLRKQDRLGWQNFIQGFIPKEFKACQQQHLINIGSQKSDSLWIARMQNKIWLIAWDLWQHRNDILHGDGSRIHSRDYRATNNQVIAEWTTGPESLSTTLHGHLFRGSLRQRLSSSISEKRQWLTSVWAARDNDNSASAYLRDATADRFYERWKKRYNPPATESTSNGDQQTP